MKKGLVVLAMVGLMALSGQSATAGTRHHKSNTTAISERVRNAQAYSAPAVRFSPDVRYFDEALSPPAGH